MRVLITGIGGFIGSHCLEYLLEKTDWHILGLDSFRHKGTYSRLNEISAYDPKRVEIFPHDLSAPIDLQLENQLMGRTLNSEKSIDLIINFASDSAVERSITDPGQCWRNNCELIFNMLELTRRVQPKLFLQISTDEVYGEAVTPHKEWEMILPSNPYSASKAAQEALCIAYWRTYKLPIVIVNCMNAIGEWQDKEKFLPKLIWKIATEQKMEIYGEPNNIGSRYYIHCKAIADAIHFISKLPPVMQDKPARYNIVGNLELNNLEMAQYVASIVGKPLDYQLIPAEAARKGYDKRYALDGAKLNSLGWTPPESTLESIKRVVEWTLAHPHWIF